MIRLNLMVLLITTFLGKGKGLDFSKQYFTKEAKFKTNIFAISVHKNQSRFECQLIRKTYFEIWINIYKQTFKLSSSLKMSIFELTSFMLALPIREQIQKKNKL